MAKLVPYDKPACLLSYSLQLKWGVCLKPLEFLDYPNSYFFILRDILIGLCLFESIKSIYHFKGFLGEPPMKLSTLWYKDRFLALPSEVMHWIYFAHRLISMLSCLLLSYATFFFAPHLMWPWVIYCCGYLAFRLIKISLRATISNLPRNQFWPILSVIYIVLKVGFVTFCKRRFETALESLSD